MIQAGHVWFWLQMVLPFTSALTLILTLIICNNTPNNAPTDELPQISQLGTGQAYVPFAIGFCLLFPQLILIVLGRLRLLLKTQDHVSRWLLYFFHAIPMVAGIFMLIMATVSVENNLAVHLTGAFTMFGLISAYVVIHTILAFYLWMRRATAPLHASIWYSVYFLALTVLLVTFVIVWIATSKAIPEYLASASPFLYFFGFVPQLWAQRRQRS